MRMLGIDPGLQATGWGLVRFSAHRLYHEGHGIIRTTTKMSDAERLCAIADGLRDVIRDYRPESAMIEEIFVSQNPRSALRLGMARGVAIQACGAAGLGVGEIAARAAKQAVTGTGKADKKQVSAMVARLLAIEEPPSDAADALAIAIAGVQSGHNFSAQKGSTPAGSGLQAAIDAALAKETL